MIEIDWLHDLKRYIKCDEQAEALNYAIECVRKHTPKKPNWLYDDEPYCPTCQCALREYEEVCGECTQLIDWGE